MNIPRRLQIFPKPVVITFKDRDRLSPHLANWKRLNELFILGIPESDLERLVILELMGKQRTQMLERLAQRITAVRRETLILRIEQCLNDR